MIIRLATKPIPDRLDWKRAVLKTTIRFVYILCNVSGIFLYKHYIVADQTAIQFST